MPCFSSRFGALRRRRLLGLLEQHEVVRDHVADVEVNDPVHQIEANETYREYDAGILVDVRRRYAYLRNVEIRTVGAHRVGREEDGIFQ